jgi:hypothetical protein
MKKPRTLFQRKEVELTLNGDTYIIKSPSLRELSVVDRLQAEDADEMTKLCKIVSHVLKDDADFMEAFPTLDSMLDGIYAEDVEGLGETLNNLFRPKNRDK